MNVFAPLFPVCLIVGTAILAPLSSSFADTIAQWSFTGAAGSQASTAVTNVIVGMSASTVTRGSTLTASAGAGSISSSGWPNAFLATADYEFSVTVPAGGTLTLTNVAFQEKRSSTGPNTLELRSNADAFAAAVNTTPSTPLIYSDTTAHDRNFALPTSYENLSAGTYTFRIFGYGSSNANGTWRLANHSTLGGLVLTGTFTGAAPPGNLALSFAPASIVESAGPAASTGTISRTGATTAELTVTLVNPDPSEIAIPATVVIPAGQASATFAVEAVNDLLADGPQTVTVTASGLNFISTTQTMTVQDDGDTSIIIINEVLADPAVDSNGDNTFSATDDEFVELVNPANTELDISGWTIFDATNPLPRHTFPANTLVPAHGAIVVFGGGTPNSTLGAFGGALVQKASDVNKLSLNNTGGDSVTIKNTDGLVVAFMAYGDLTGNNGKSLNLNPDLTGTARVAHPSVPGAVGNFSPGTRTDGTPFVGAYASWVAIEFPGVTDPAIISFGADPDGDGVGNGLEFVFASNPKEVSQPPITLLGGTPDTLHFTHRMVKTLPTTMALNYQWSTDLTNWYLAGMTNSAGVSVTFGTDSTGTSNADYNVLTAHGSLAEGVAERIFVRAQITGP